MSTKHLFSPTWIILGECKIICDTAQNTNSIILRIFLFFLFQSTENVRPFIRIWFVSRNVWHLIKWKAFLVLVIQIQSERLHFRPFKRHHHFHPRFHSFLVIKNCIAWFHAPSIKIHIFEWQEMSHRVLVSQNRLSFTRHSSQHCKVPKRKCRPVIQIQQYF